jgi:autophagy-related protein 33
MISSKRRKHPYLLWVCVTSILGSFGVDFWFYRKKGLASWSGMVAHDVGVPAMKKWKTSTKEEDVVVVETEGEVNGEIVERDMERECKLQRVRTWCSGVALTMSIVGLWGDRA